MSLKNKKCRKPEALRQEAHSLLSTLANLNGSAQYSRKRCANPRYAYEFVLPWLVDKGLVEYHPGYFRGEKDWKPSVIKARGAFFDALEQWTGASELPVPDTSKKPWALMTEFNEFLAGFRFTGCSPPRLVRYTRPGGLHGRMYSLGFANYTNRSFEERSFIRIDGEETQEPDLKASHLTILLTLLEQPVHVPGSLVPLIHNGRLTGDPYHFEGFHRDEVKRFVARCIGSGKTSTGWKDEDTEQLHKFPRALREAVLERYPFLTAEGFYRLLGVRGDDVSTRLQYLESEVMYAVTMRLMRLGIPSLPIHDGTRVPASASSMTCDFIRDEFLARFGITPLVTVKENYRPYRLSKVIDIDRLIEEIVSFYSPDTTCHNRIGNSISEMNANNLYMATPATPLISMHFTGELPIRFERVSKRGRIGEGNPTDQRQYTDQDVEKVRVLKAGGISLGKIALEMGMTKSKVQRILAAT